MADILADAHSFIADQFAANLSQTVTYSDGTDSASIAMTHQRKTYSVDNGMGGIEDVVREDWTVRASDLVLTGSTPHVPARGDTITTADGDVFEVVGDGSGGQPYMRSDPYGYTLRIHTVRKTTAGT